MRAQCSAFHYLGDPLRLKLAAEAVESALVAPGLNTFDAIACRGLSGVTIASLVSAKTGKPLCIVRKASAQEPSHGFPVECAVDVRAYVIVDDFVSSGTTVTAIQAAIANEEQYQYANEPKARCLAIVTYCSTSNAFAQTVYGIPLIEAFR